MDSNATASTDMSSIPASTDYYFNSYSHFGIHEEMLKDQVRTMAYKNAILRNKKLFEGKVVLDVGCGSAILSMFAASAGASLVIGVDMSEMIHQSEQIIKDNGFEGKIVLLKGKMEEVVLPVDKVDIIISEWMGYFLLYESMLDTVIWARDRYLKADGLMFPDKANMFISAIEDTEFKHNKIGFWDDVYGYDMSCIKKIAIHEPLVDIVDSKAVVTNECLFKKIDIATVTKAELNFNVPFELSVLRRDYIHGFVVYFDIDFSYGPNPVHFSTGPFDRYTHWKQVVLYTKTDLSVQPGDTVSGMLACGPNDKNPRDLNITLDFAHKSQDGSKILSTEVMQYKMA